MSTAFVEDGLFTAFVSSWVGVSPGPPAGITYTLSIQFPSGAVIVSNLRPQRTLLPANHDVVALPAGTPVLVHQVASRCIFDVLESPDLGPCPGPS